MVARFVAALLVMVSSAAIAIAQQQSSPIPAYPAAPPSSIEPQPLPPLPPMSEPTSAPIGRVFCEQPVTVRLADPEAVAERYRPFIGIWSDASWTPLLCAALVVENVAPDGTARILYVFGPMGAGARGAGGVLQGTGIIRDGELRFQNSDRSQFAFRSLYADLDGRLTTPKNETYQAVFKKAP